MGFPRSPVSVFVLTAVIVAVTGPGALAHVQQETDASSVGVTVLRNLDEFSAHWGVAAGYDWRGRVHVRLEWRQDGILGEDLLVLQTEAALVKTRGFILESGYHHTLETSSFCEYDVIPVRVSFPFAPVERLHVIPNFTFWRILADNSHSLEFAALDFLWDGRYALGLELNVNQDFRYHALDVRVGYRW